MVMQEDEELTVSSRLVGATLYIRIAVVASQAEVDQHRTVTTKSCCKAAPRKTIMTPFRIWGNAASRGRTKKRQKPALPLLGVDVRWSSRKGTESPCV